VQETAQLTDSLRSRRARQMEQERAENMNDSNARRQEFIKREKIIQVSLSMSSPFSK